MKTSVLRYNVLIKREGKTYVSYVPTLGISDFGKTITEAKKNTQSAIACHIAGLVKTNTDVPAPDKQNFIISQAQITFRSPLRFA